MAPPSLASLACMTVAQAIRELNFDRYLSRPSRQGCVAITLTKKHLLNTKSRDLLSNQHVFAHCAEMEPHCGLFTNDDAPTFVHEQTRVRLSIRANQSCTIGTRCLTAAPRNAASWLAIYKNIYRLGGVNLLEGRLSRSSGMHVSYTH